MTVLSFLLLSLSLSVPAPAAPLTGRVVDSSGRAVPRAVVRVLDADGRVHAEVFTMSDGRFSVDAPPAGCRIEATLTGFRPSTMACAADVQLTLEVAPLAESIVVSANRTETPGSQVAASVTVFSADAIERRQAPPVADMLATSPGVRLSRSGGYGNVASVFVRGGESNYNKVLLDGIPLNEPGGNFNFSNVSSENLERIEIVRGAHSALFGSDAMASVVQLFTRRATAGSRPSVTAAVEAGTYDTGRAQAAARGASGAFDYSVGAAYFVTDNQVPNNRFRNDTVTATAGYQLGRRTSLRGVFRGEFGKAGTPGQTAFGRPDLDASFERNDAVGGVTLLHDVSATFRQRASYGLAATRQSSRNLLDDTPYTPTFRGRSAPFEFPDFTYHSRNHLRRHHASYQADWTIGASSPTVGTHQVTGVADWDSERGTLEDVLAEDSTMFSRDNVGVSLQHQASWPRLFAAAGVRLERNESFGFSAAPRVAVAVIAKRSSGAIGETKVKGGAGRGIKEPTALQTFSRSPFFLGNPDLEPEEARSVEIGIEQRFAHDRARVDATWFDNSFTNIIATRTISFSPFTSQYFNIGRSRARGLELAAAVAPTPGIEARGGYTFLDSKVIESRSPDDPVFGVGRWLFRRPRHSGFVDVSASRGRLTASLTGVIVGRRVDSDFSALSPAITENDGYSVWSARGGYRILRHLWITAAVDNLTGADYMEPLGYVGLGRAVRVGLRAGF